LYAEAARRGELIAKLEAAGAVRNEEVEFRRKDGSTFWGLTSATSVRDEKTGQFLYFDGAIHDITEHKQAALRRIAQYEVARALAESATPAEAALWILPAVCDCLRWDFGSLWIVENKKNVLKCVEHWARPGLKLKEFATATRAAIFEPGVGLPGRVWRSGKSAWVADVLADTNFPRLTIAARCGLHSALAAPIVLGKKTLGVVEFFSRNIREPDTDLLEMFAALGSQIGQFIERKRGEENIRALNKSLEQRVEDRTRELTAANAALRESESRFRTVTQHTPAAIVLLDTETGKFVEANETATKLFGLTREQLLATGPVDVSPEFQPDGQRSAKGAAAKIQGALRGKFEHFEWTHLHSSGAQISCELRVSRMPAVGRRLVIGAILDISARKKAEAELLRALEQEKELNELKSNFVSVVSHEFRTPLGVIMSAADILENYFDRLKPEQRAGHLQDVAYAARQMAGLMEEVLLLGRVEAGRMEFKPEPIDLGAFCRRLVDEQLSASSRKCPITLALPRKLATAWCDEGLLRHIFTNLLGNAIKYSAAGSPVNFSLSEANRDAVFCISDKGIGIPEADHKRLFETFHRAQNVGEVPGTGLGLAIVKRCVDLHEGIIEVMSKAGLGTTFTVRLKLFKPRKGKESARKKIISRKAR
jgi:PAS domain S-box-containing protein